MLRFKHLVEEVGRCEGCGQVITIESGKPQGTPPDEVNARILEIFANTPQYCCTCGKNSLPSRSASHRRRAPIGSGPRGSTENARRPQSVPSSIFSSAQYPPRTSDSPTPFPARRIHKGMSEPLHFYFPISKTFSNTIGSSKHLLSPPLKCPLACSMMISEPSLSRKSS